MAGIGAGRLRTAWRRFPRCALTRIVPVVQNGGDVRVDAEVREGKYPGMTDEPLEAALEAIDPEHRLPGEVEAEQSLLSDDALHWRRVYQELVDFKRDLLTTVEEREQEADPPITHEIDNDLEVLRAELDRLERRKHFWQDRARQLRAD